MTASSDVGAAMRELGLRSTPQRRAILLAFQGGPAEHLSADEVHARAAAQLPDIGRGTVYATLAEFTERGLLAAVGAPEPVRYESNTRPHHHFRCRLCLRLFDLPGPAALADEPVPAGFTIERIETRAEGVCADCGSYQRGLKAGVRTIEENGALREPAPAGLAASELSGSLGTLLLAASPRGLVRVAFPGHGDASALRAHVKSRRGSQAARAHLEQAAGALNRYLAGSPDEFDCAVDWDSLDPAGVAALHATRAIPYAARCFYTLLDTDLSTRELGWTMGANPIPIVAPCHRVTRGVEVPQFFVGGSERRRWLNDHEREYSR